MRTGMAYMGLGFEFLAVFLILGGAGFGLDAWIAGKVAPGLFFILGLFLGFAAGLWHLIRRANELAEITDRMEAELREARADESRPREPGSAEIRARMDRIERGVDRIHRQLGETFGDGSTGESGPRR